MNLVQVGFIHTQQVSELEKVSFLQGRSGRSELPGCSITCSGKDQTCSVTREKWKAVPTEGLSRRGLRWPPRQDPGHIQFSDSKPRKSRQVMHS